MSNIEYIINSEGASVFIIRNWLSDSEELKDKLKNTIEWKQYSGKAYDKEYLVPRRMYMCGEISNYYNSDVNPWINEVKDIKDRIENEFNIQLNSCVLNEYRDGKDYIAYHSDREVLGTNNVVVSVSLGGPRDFYMKSKINIKTTIKTQVRSGDLMAMSGRTQELYTHSVPKRAHANYRISLTYRLSK